MKREKKNVLFAQTSRQAPNNKLERIILKPANNSKTNKPTNNTNIGKIGNPDQPHCKTDKLKKVCRLDILCISAYAHWRYTLMSYRNALMWEVAARGGGDIDRIIQGEGERACIVATSTRPIRIWIFLYGETTRGYHRIHFSISFRIADGMSQWTSVFRPTKQNTSQTTTTTTTKREQSTR